MKVHLVPIGGTAMVPLAALLSEAGHRVTGSDRGLFPPMSDELSGLGIPVASGFAAEGMPAYVRLQEAEFAAEKSGYTATRHQREVGTGYFDLVTSAISPNAETVALSGSTETEQFHSA